MKESRKSLRRLSVAVLIAALVLPGALFAADEIKIGFWLLFFTGGAALLAGSCARGPNLPPTSPTTSLGRRSNLGDGDGRGIA